MWSYRIGRIFGFPIELNLSFLLLLGFVLLWSGGLTGVYVVLLGFASVLLHELGHALVARRLGVRIAGIELRFFGGAAKMIDPPRTARDEIAIAAAGPAVSFVLAALALAGSAVSGAAIFELLSWINLAIAVFNLTPALPMDGGRILRALLSGRLGYERATEVSIRVARGFSILFGLIGVVTGRPYLVMLAVVLWWMGSAERAASLRGYGGYGYAGYGGTLPGDGWHSPADSRLFVHGPIRIIVRRF